MIAVCRGGCRGFTTPCYLGRDRSRGQEGKTSTLRSRTAGHRYRQPRPPVRCRLGIGGFPNCSPPAEAAMRLPSSSLDRFTTSAHECRLPFANSHTRKRAPPSNEKIGARSREKSSASHHPLGRVLPARYSDLEHDLSAA